MRVRRVGLAVLSAAGVASLAVWASFVTTSTRGQTEGRPNILLIAQHADTARLLKERLRQVPALDIAKPVR